MPAGSSRGSPREFSGRAAAAAAAAEAGRSGSRAARSTPLPLLPSPRPRVTLGRARRAATVRSVSPVVWHLLSPPLTPVCPTPPSNRRAAAVTLAWFPRTWTNAGRAFIFDSVHFPCLGSEFSVL